MKSTLATIALVFLNYFMYAQNKVGINTPNPQATLDVRGGYRFGGTANNIQYDTTTGRIQWNGASLFAPSYQPIITHSLSGDGLWAGGGLLQYRGISNVAFSVDAVNNSSFFGGYLGIGGITPFVPLTFSSDLGQKISLYAANGSVGFSVQSGLFQIHVDDPATDFGFGIRQGNSFTEKVRIKGNGNVGIGITNPNAPLSFPSVFGKKITLYPAATGDVGIGVQGNLLELFADNPNADIAFGYDQAGTFTERMRIKGNGSLVLNGNAGTAGQVLQSNGSTASPTWVSSTKTLYNNTNKVSTTSELTVGDNVVNYPGLAQTFSVTGNAKVMVTVSMMTFGIGCSSCGASEADIYIDLDGAHAKGFSTTVPSGAHAQFNCTYLLDVVPGTHTIQVAVGAVFNLARFGCASCGPLWGSSLIVQVMPE